ncbi:transmembrane protein, putative [Medicago truncatula]|uniref:Transmembrane protein, putative n=1 Tax=Medicago truncatula TaxID=3880 RepID=G7IWH4_MEDTR|nr:transmembrane protein, putative [Medicago truncatula]
MASNLTREASYPVAASPVSCSCALFAYFCFELASDFNKKVLDNDVSFPMALV